MLLLIPGPVITNPAVRAALAYDFAPWDNDFCWLYAKLRARLLRIAGGHPDVHVALALQGCGHFITEAAIRTFLPPGRKLLIPTTGSYDELGIARRKAA
jgi:2-aminoethylphosphonate-pyruvate transaminase